jgi:hypothetical protein
LNETPRQTICRHIRTVPDWPAPGVQFRDITPLLSTPRVFRVLIDEFVHRYFDVRPDAIAGLDARGFIIGSVVAYELNIGFVPIRKKGKLPFTTVQESYELEYGSATVEMHTDAVKACGLSAATACQFDGDLGYFQMHGFSEEDMVEHTPGIDAQKAAAEAATTAQMAALFAPLSQAQLEAIVAGTKALESAVT